MSRVLRIFLDSNVMVSGLFSDRGAPRLILDTLSLELPVLKAVTGEFNVSEVERTLKDKLPEALPVFRSALSAMAIEIVPLPDRRDLEPLAGLTASKDLPVLASAIRGRGDVLVTGDEKHLLKIDSKALPFRILSPADFLNDFLPRFLRSISPD